MKIEKFIALIADEFDETAPELFKPDTKYKEIKEWSSLTALSVIALIDEEFEKKLTGADLHNCNTLKDLYTLVESKNV